MRNRWILWQQTPCLKYLSVAQQWGAKKVVGVDIDPELVRAAWRRRLTMWSLQKPMTPFEGMGSSQKKKRKRHKSTPCPLHNYFPQSMDYIFGSLPIPDATLGPPDSFPHNISFHTANWVTHELPDDRECYDIVLACVPSCLCLGYLRSQQLDSADFQYLNGYISTVETKDSWNFSVAFRMY